MRLFIQRKEFFVTWIRRLASSLAVLCTATLMAACASGANDRVPKKDMVGVSIAGIGHLGLMVGIPEFFVNGQWGGNNSGWGWCVLRTAARQGGAAHDREGHLADL